MAVRRRNVLILLSTFSTNFSTTSHHHYRKQISLANLFQSFGFPSSNLHHFLSHNPFLFNSDPSHLRKSLSTLFSFKIPQKTLISLVHDCPSVLEPQFLHHWELAFPQFKSKAFNPSPLMIANLLRCSRKFQLNPLELSQKVEIFKGLGFSDDVTARVLEEFPSAVVMTENKIVGVIDFLVEFGVPRDEIDRVVRLYPRVLGFGVEDRLKPLIHEMRRLGFSRREIKAEIVRDPGILGMEIGEFSRCLKLLQSLKCREVIKESIFGDGLVRACFEVKLRVDCLCGRGLIRRDALKVLWKEPRLMTYDLWKTSKFFDTSKPKPKDEIEETQALPAKRKTMNDINEDDSVLAPDKKKLAGSTPTKKLKSGSGRGIPQKPVDLDGSGEDDEKDVVSPIKSGGRGRGGRGASTQTTGGRGRGGGRGTTKKSADLEESDEDDEKNAAKSGGRGRGGRGASTPASGGRGRGGGRGGFMNFGERKDPPHKGEKEVPEGAPNCLAGLTFVISGTLDSLEREEAEDLIKRHGGRVTGSVSKKTNYLLCDEDIGGRKSEKAKELGTSFLTEDGLFDMIRASKPAKAPKQDESKKSPNKAVAVPSPSKVPLRAETKAVAVPSPSKIHLKAETKASLSSCSPSNQAKSKKAATVQSNVMWTEKHRPTNPKDIIGNQSLVLQLRNWLKGWHEQFSNTGGNKKQGKKQNDSTSKKAVLLSGTPGIGKTTSAKLVCQELGFLAIEVNASDSRGKADSKIEKGISGSNSNSIKELVTNEALGTNMNRPKQSKTVLIMDEVDGMSAGDRGGVADLIASIKISKIPIICICNDRYSQKLKSLVNYCLLLSYRKPTKQQMAKKFMEVAKAERLQVNEIALEELAERVNGDMRMALNQLQYMGLSMSVINYDDIRQRLLTNAKDEDISPFTAVDKLFGFNAGKMKMDERINLSMSDPDLVPLLIQENYINYRPSSAGKDDNGIKRMALIARAAESIADGDIVNVQIRRYRQWQLSQTSSLASCILPASLLHGSREILEQGERNFNRFGGWLGKNSTRGKNMRLMDDMHVHILASRESSSGRDTIRLEYLTLLLKKLTEPLRVLPKAEAVEQVVEFMNTYSISQEDFDTIVELSKFKGHPNPLDGILPAVKSALTKAYKEQSKTRMVRAADLITLPGIKKAPKKRIAAILEPVDEGVEQGDDNNALDESEEENNSDADESGAVTGEKLKSELQSLSSKGMQVQLELKGTGSSSKKASGGRGKGASASGQKVAQTAKAPAKRKR